MMTHLRPLKEKNAGASIVSALLCGVLLWSPGCSTPPLTEVIITVDSAFPAGELSEIHLVIVRNGETRTVAVDLTDLALPFTQGVVHRGGSLDLSVSARGFGDGGFIVEQLVPIDRFVEGETVHARVELSPSCVGVSCEAGSVCMNGACVALLVDAGVADAGVADASAGDGGRSDAQPLLDALADLAVDVSDPGQCPSGTVDIVGPYICAADCPDCSLRCNEGDCQVTCRSGASCRVESDAYTIDASCEEGSSCSLHTTEQGGVSAQCARSTCDVTCEGDGPCETMCSRGSCGVACGANENCTLRGCASEECIGDRRVCGRACP